MPDLFLNRMQTLIGGSFHPMTMRSVGFKGDNAHDRAVITAVFENIFHLGGAPPPDTLPLLEHFPKLFRAKPRPSAPPTHTLKAVPCI